MGRVGLANPVVQVALVALVTILGPRKLPGRILVVGIADAPRTRLTNGIAVAIAVTTWLTDLVGVVRSCCVGTLAFRCSCSF